MLVSTRVDKDKVILNLSGRFDKTAKIGLEAAILGAQEIGSRHIILNLANVSWVDSAGLGKIFLTYHHLNRKKVRISIVDPKPQVKELLEMVNIPSIVPIYKTEEEAVSSDTHEAPACNSESSDVGKKNSNPIRT